MIKRLVEREFPLLVKIITVMAKGEKVTKCIGVTGSLVVLAVLPAIFGLASSMLVHSIEIGCHIYSQIRNIPYVSSD